jgi:hypothetical protein
MSSKLIRAVKSKWDKSSIIHQKALVIRFIEIYGSIYSKGDWLQYLATEFNLSDNGEAAPELDQVYH